MNEHGSIASELITRGWGRAATEAPDGSVCLRGAAMYAYTGVPVAQGKEKRVPASAVRAYLDACNVMSEIVGQQVHVFNDAPGRTFDEVLRVAKEADAILDAQRDGFR